MLALRQTQPNALYFANINANPLITLEELRDKVVNLVQTAKTLQAKADAEHRELNEEELREFTGVMNAVDATKADIDRRERLLEQESALATLRPRQTIPNDVEMQVAPTQAQASSAIATLPQRAQDRPRITGGEPNGSTRTAWGFRSLGEFAMSVRRAGRGQLDPRLVANAPSTYSSEGIGEDGGFAVPPDFRAEIMTKAFGEESLLSRTDQQVVSGNQITVPTDETTLWGTGGVKAYWLAEGAAKPQSKLELGQTTIRLHKLAALVPVTDELLEDATAIASYLRQRAPAAINYEVNNAIINGDGIGKPLGILQSPALVTVAKTGTQANDSIVFENISTMWSRLHASCRPRAVWIVNQDAEATLPLMTIGGNTPYPVYMPPGGLSVAPYSTLLGRPVIATEVASVLGDVGDIILADLTQYLTAVKAGGLRQDISIHLWFDYDVTAFRFVLRVGGAPWWQSAVGRRGSNTNTLSCFVTLAAR